MQNKIFEWATNRIMNHVYVLLGANVGDRMANLRNACNHLQLQVGPVIEMSPIYETAPWGMAEQAPFLNQVLHMTTTLLPEELLQTILAIELAAGRKRLQKNGPRIIDVDILFYNNLVIQLPNLVIPHPEISNRRFVLTPLNDVAPQYIHPKLEKTIQQLLQLCPDPLPVEQYKPEA